MIFWEQVSGGCAVTACSCVNCVFPGVVVLRGASDVVFGVGKSGKKKNRLK